MNIELLNQASAFICQEADMLDHAEYPEWLALWAEKGLYIVPINPDENDFANTLNYAYDDAKMRELRVARLGSGESISTSPAPRTIRTVSRFRLLADDGKTLRVRCAQNLREFRKEIQKHYTANLTYTLVRDGNSFRIQQKVVRLLNSSDALQCIGYIP